MTTRDLNSGNTRSCGCLRKDKASHSNKKYNHFDLSGGYGVGYTSKGEKFKFDIEDYERIKDLCWYIESGGRVVARNSEKHKTYFKLHRVITNCPEGYEVDHINHNQTDNRKANLRICTRSQNAKNMKIPRNNVSGCKGVNYRKDTGKWTARITVNGKAINLGCYSTFDDAVFARNDAELTYYKEFSYRKDDSNGITT